MTKKIELPEDLPIWANWIARDEDGDLYWFCNEPVKGDDVWNPYPYQPDDFDE